ncbi:hypothetical protein Zmor_009314 [Zophobas morio]|uniref:Uncharacterized protein n=1 Tax=Zophobas morio TaxID=2755281 RepID=A0AA38MIK3_9CUCU|nr:hypothetical protein Zmor_009093 [Zophobas morio]KAJ3657518.1 hypothetical protein Zmor_009314 [Zophobas morio]
MIFIYDYSVSPRSARHHGNVKSTTQGEAELEPYGCPELVKGQLKGTYDLCPSHFPFFRKTLSHLNS